MAPLRPEMIRINTRIRPDQHKFIKAEAAKGTVIDGEVFRKTEGEIFREIIDVYMRDNKK